MGGGNLRPVVLQGKNTKYIAGYIGLNRGSRGRVGRGEIDKRIEEKTINI
jgi:hypothetical protein